MIMLCGCATDLKVETSHWSSQQIYSAAFAAMNKHKYSKAIDLYNILEDSYPYGIYAQQGMLDLAYCYYKDNQIDTAIATLNDFLNIYPTSLHADYALYLKGCISYDRMDTLSKLAQQDSAERDLSGVRIAYDTLNELIKNYPQSKYYASAVSRLKDLTNMMARAELYIARYYMHINEYLAAIMHARSVIENYATSSYTEEAQAIAVIAYSKLGISPEFKHDTRLKNS